MRKGDKCAAVLLAILVAAVSWFTRCNYKSIASEGLTLSSIVLAVYVAAILGLINTNLAKKMAVTPTHTKRRIHATGSTCCLFQTRICVCSCNYYL